MRIVSREREGSFRGLIRSSRHPSFNLFFIAALRFPWREQAGLINHTRNAGSWGRVYTAQRIMINAGTGQNWRLSLLGKHRNMSEQLSLSCPIKPWPLHIQPGQDWGAKAGLYIRLKTTPGVFTFIFLSILQLHAVSYRCLSFSSEDFALPCKALCFSGMQFQCWIGLIILRLGEEEEAGLINEQIPVPTARRYIILINGYFSQERSLLLDAVNKLMNK